MLASGDYLVFLWWWWWSSLVVATGWSGFWHNITSTKSTADWMAEAALEVLRGGMLSDVAAGTVDLLEGGVYFTACFAILDALEDGGTTVIGEDTGTSHDSLGGEEENSGQNESGLHVDGSFSCTCTCSDCKFKRINVKKI
ncbi:hypothetical protein BDF22DRAFT_681009, partial [Syncephalis plumigaleata]